MVQALGSLLAMNKPDATKHHIETQQANAEEGMPIPVQASSSTKSNGIAAEPQQRRDSLQELERKSRKHSSSISVSASSPEVERSGWPLLYQMIDVDPNTEASDFPEVARRSLIRLSLKHGPPVLNEHPEAEERWNVITEAYDALSDPEQKKLYDTQST